MEYISLGTDSLNEEYFYDIVNVDGERRVKPVGGLWCSDYEYPTYFAWMDFILKKSNYYMNYMCKDNPFKFNGVIVTLKDDARVFQLDTVEATDELENGYRFDFEKLANDYDAMYANPSELLELDTPYSAEYKKIYVIKSLVVFDLAKIEGYKKAVIDVEPFNYVNPSYKTPWYETTIDDTLLQVTQESETYKEFLRQLSDQLKDFIFHLRINHPEYPSNKMAGIIKDEIMRVLGTDISNYALKNDLDSKRIAYSLATKTLRRVK